MVKELSPSRVVTTLGVGGGRRTLPGRKVKGLQFPDKQNTGRLVRSALHRGGVGWVWSVTRGEKKKKVNDVKCQRT